MRARRDSSDARARAAQARFAGEARSHGVAEAVEPVRALRGGLARQKVACTRVGTEFGCVKRARGLGVWVGNGVLVQTIVCPLAALLLRAALRGSGLVARALLRADLFEPLQ